MTNRYQHTHLHGSVIDDTGYWVRYSDYAKLKTEKKILFKLLVDYMIAEHGENVLLKKGYKPELEKLVEYLGWSRDYINDQIIFTPPVRKEND